MPKKYLKIENEELLKIRDVLAEDIPRIVEINYLAWKVTYPNEEYGITLEDVERRVGSIEKKITRWNDSLIREGFKHILVENGDNLILGYAVLNIIDSNQSRLQVINVDPNFHRSGAGSALTKTALNYFDDNVDIIVEVTKYNKNAIRFYEKFGFEIEEEIDGLEVAPGKWMPLIRMIKKVKII